MAFKCTINIRYYYIYPIHWSVLCIITFFKFLIFLYYMDYIYALFYIIFYIILYFRYYIFFILYNILYYKNNAYI